MKRFHVFFKEVESQKEYEKAYILVLMFQFLVFNELYKYSENLLQDLSKFEEP